MTASETKFSLRICTWHIWWIYVSLEPLALSPKIADCHFVVHLSACSHKTSIRMPSPFVQTLYLILQPLSSSFQFIDNPSDKNVFSIRILALSNVRMSTVHSHCEICIWAEIRLNCLPLFEATRWLVSFVWNTPWSWLRKFKIYPFRKSTKRKIGASLCHSSVKMCALNL